MENGKFDNKEMDRHERRRLWQWQRMWTESWCCDGDFHFWDRSRRDSLRCSPLLR
jgi:hypothetical protein